MFAYVQLEPVGDLQCVENLRRPQLLSVLQTEAETHIKEMKITTMAHFCQIKQTLDIMTPEHRQVTVGL